MKDQAVFKGIAAALLTTTVAVPTVSQAAGRMTSGQANALFNQCKAVADVTPSNGRGTFTKMWCAVVDREGKTLLIKATDTSESPSANMTTDAWRASIEIALAKAYTAVSVSSDEQALTSKDVGDAASQTPLENPDALFGVGNTNLYRALTGAVSLAPDDSINQKHHGIVTFGGGVPVYSCQQATGLGALAAPVYGLIGALGVSGDTVTNDILVAEAAVFNAGFTSKPCID